MNKKHSIPLVLPVLIFGLLSFYTGSWVSASSKKSDSPGDSIENLIDRVAKLEEQVADLKEQIKNLASKPYPRVLTVPGTPSFPGKNLPPGATEHEINGMKYWLVPLKEGK